MIYPLNRLPHIKIKFCSSLQQLRYPFRIDNEQQYIKDRNLNYHSYSYNLDKKSNEHNKKWRKKKSPSHTRYCPIWGITFQKSKEIEGKTKMIIEASSFLYPILLSGNINNEANTFRCKLIPIIPDCYYGTS